MTTVPGAATLRIVPVANADIDRLAALVNRAFGRYSDLLKGPRTSPEGYREEAGDDGRILVLEVDGSLAAAAMVAPAERFIETHDGEAPPSPHPWQGALYYGLAGVEPARMNSGLGKDLLAHVERIAREEGFRAIALGTLREFGLVDYYTRLGYEVFHETVFAPGHWDMAVPHCYCEMVKLL